MKSLLFIILAGYAVRCDETSNNYYVIEMVEDDPPIREIRKPFRVYWNVPSIQCKSKKIPFDDLYEKFGVIQNRNDSFRGEKITILYDPGLFPALLKNDSSGRFKFRNGGVPQEGDLEKHIAAFRNVLEQSIPDKNFNGVAIIDFESWRPVFRQNFGVLVPYKDVSYEIERKIHWWWPKQWIQAEAKKRFEESARAFMQTTVSLAKQLRPHAIWGYYAFPYCFNMANKNMVERCADKVMEENDSIYWLWAESTALYPSIYSSRDLSSSQLAALIRGRVREARRVKRDGTPILPYFWYRYREGGFLSEIDLDTTLQTLYKSNASGFIIWGSSNDVNTVDKCLKLYNYVDKVMGPAIAKYTKQNIKTHGIIDDIKDINERNDTLSTINDIVINDTSAISTLTISTERDVHNSDTIEQAVTVSYDPEFHWDPPENYTDDIIKYVEEEFLKRPKSNLSSNDMESNETVLKRLNDSILIDLILDTLFNNVQESAIDMNKTDFIYSKDKMKGLPKLHDSTINPTNYSAIEETDENNLASSTIIITVNTINSLERISKDAKKGKPVSKESSKYVRDESEMEESIEISDYLDIETTTLNILNNNNAIEKYDGTNDDEFNDYTTPNDMSMTPRFDDATESLIQEESRQNIVEINMLKDTKKGFPNGKLAEEQEVALKNGLFSFNGINDSFKAVETLEVTTMSKEISTNEVKNEKEAKISIKKILREEINNITSLKLTSTSSTDQVLIHVS